MYLHVSHNTIVTQTLSSCYWTTLYTCNYYHQTYTYLNDKLYHKDLIQHPCNTVIIQINAVVFIKFLALKMQRLFQGSICLVEAFIMNLVTTTVNLLSCRLAVFIQGQRLMIILLAPTASILIITVSINMNRLHTLSTCH